ncbi:MAG: 4-hydroxybenzoyl-CoA reductase subunit beta [Methylobacteriaceae bacterium]|nr:4-hydroxybenzoyl-CoA reductase subunit beta [Rhodoblastus sp.]MCC0003834.1 4-hydroxybenzoyl-CoA reductase subunit beta [Methylobacteriaceae bacterium]
MSVELANISIARPATIEEAVALASGPDARYLAGGTDLLVNMRRGITRAARLIDLAGVDALKSISCDASGVVVGAGVELARLIEHEEISRRFPAIVQAAAAIAAPGHRNVATLGGNLCLDTRCVYYNQSEWWRSANAWCLKNRGDTCHVAPQGERCHAAFSGDLAPVLLVLGAEIEVAGPAGRRRMPLAELYVEDGRAHLTLAHGELLVAVHLPADGRNAAYEKVRLRGAIDYPLAGVAVAMTMQDGRIESLRVGLTGLNSRPLLVAGTEAFAGRAVDDDLLKAVDRLVQHQAQPVRTTLAAAHYRRLAAAAVARRLVRRLAGG